MVDEFRRYSSLLRSGGLRFGTADASFIAGSFVTVGRRFRTGLFVLLDDLANGSITFHTFSLRAGRLLSGTFYATYALGALSVDPFHSLTARDLAVIDRELVEEKRFLRAFAQDIRHGFVHLDPTVRAVLYLRSLRGMFELGRLESLPPVPLIWKLGPTEHCGPCIFAAAHSPYKKDRWTHLDLPILPGIPGSGEICNGLTRCGCIITPTTLALNTELQERMRGLLNAILEGGEA